MDDAKALKIIYDEVKKRGIPLSDFNAFFYAKRDTSPTYDHFKEDYCNTLIKPSQEIINPSLITNGSYNSFSTLKDWYLYRNSSSNPLVWDNITNSNFNIKTNMENNKNIQFNVGQDGKLFLTEDGNHRTLTLILKHYLDSYNCSNSLQQSKVDNEYSFLTNINYLHPLYLINELYRYQNEFYEEANISNACKEYFENIPTYILEYNPKDNTYLFNYNGIYKQGNIENMMTLLKNNVNYPGLQTRFINNTYYISSYNLIYKTTDKAKYNYLLNKFKNNRKPINLDEAILIEKNLDTNTYNIKVNYSYDDNTNILDINQKNELLENYLELVNTYPILISRSTISLNKFKSDLMWLDHNALDSERRISTFNRDFIDLDEKECKYILTALSKESKLMNKIKTKHTYKK